MNNLQEKLHIWALNTVEVYKTMIKEEENTSFNSYTAFYTQSDLTKLSFNPEIVIMAINPGSGGSYQKQKTNINWNLDPKKGMTADKFLQGNPFFISEKAKWHLWRRLNSILQYGNLGHILEESQNYAYTNLVFFNTPKACQLSQRIIERCAPCTIELLSILSPKFILCLGELTMDVFCKLSGSIKETLIKGELSRTYWNNTLVIHLPHTSKFYSREEMNLVGKGICLLYQKPSIPQSEFYTEMSPLIEDLKRRKEAPVTSSKELRYAIEDLFNKKMEELHYEKFRYSPICFPLNEHLLVSVSHDNKASVNIRHRDFYINGKIHYRQDLNNMDEIYPNCSEYASILRDLDYTIYAENVWLGTKSIKKFRGNNVTEIVGSIIEEIKKISMTKLSSNDNK